MKIQHKVRKLAENLRFAKYILFNSHKKNIYAIMIMPKLLELII